MGAHLGEKWFFVGDEGEGGREEKKQIGIVRWLGGRGHRRCSMGVSPSRANIYPGNIPGNSILA